MYRDVYLKVKKWICDHRISILCMILSVLCCYIMKKSGLEFTSVKDESGVIYYPFNLGFQWSTVWMLLSAFFAGIAVLCSRNGSAWSRRMDAVTVAYAWMVLGCAWKIQLSTGMALYLTYGVEQGYFTKALFRGLKGMIGVLLVVMLVTLALSTVAPLRMRNRKYRLIRTIIDAGILVISTFTLLAMSFTNAWYVMLSLAVIPLVLLAEASLFAVRHRMLAPSEMKRFSMDGFYFSKEDEELKDRLGQVLDGERGYPIHIYAPTGYGKTFLGECLIHDMMKNGEAAEMITGDTLKSSMIEMLRQREVVEEHFRDMAELKLLVIDEMEDVMQGNSFWAQTMRLVQWLTLQGVQVICLTGLEKGVRNMKDEEQTPFEAKCQEFVLHMPEQELRKEYIDEVLGFNYICLKKEELEKVYQLDSMQKVYTYLENLVRSKRVEKD